MRGKDERANTRSSFELGKTSLLEGEKNHSTKSTMIHSFPEKYWNKLEGQIKELLSLQLLSKLEQRDQYVNVESRGIDIEMVKAQTHSYYLLHAFSIFLLNW